MQVKTQLKAGGRVLNHNQTLVRDQPPRQPLKVKTKVKAGVLTANHNQTLVRATAKPR
jgi:hypothetical protein